MSPNKRTADKERPTVDSHQVKRLAALSKLFLDPKQEQKLQRELSAVLDYFALIDKVDVSGVPPAYEREEEAKADETNRLREDSPGQSSPDIILEGVPQKKDRYVRAPKVF